MASEIEYINIKDYIDGLSTTENPATTDKGIVSNPTNGPRAVPASPDALTTTATEADLVESSSIKIKTASGFQKLPGNAIAPKSVQDNVVASLAPEFDPNSTTTVKGYPYIHDGLLYVAKVSGYQGPWDASKFIRFSFSNVRYIDTEGCVVAQNRLNGNVGYSWETQGDASASGTNDYVTVETDADDDYSGIVNNNLLSYLNNGLIDEGERFIVSFMARMHSAGESAVIKFFFGGPTQYRDVSIDEHWRQFTFVLTRSNLVTYRLQFSTGSVASHVIFDVKNVQVFSETSIFARMLVSENYLDSSKPLDLSAISGIGRNLDAFRKFGCLKVDGTMDYAPNLIIDWVTYYKVPVKKGTSVNALGLTTIYSDYQSAYANIVIYDERGLEVSHKSSAGFAKEFDSDGFVSICCKISDTPSLTYRTDEDRSLEVSAKNPLKVNTNSYKILGAVKVDGSYNDGSTASGSDPWYTLHKIPVKKGAVIAASHLQPVTGDTYINFAIYDSSETFIEGFQGGNFVKVMDFDGYVSFVSRTSNTLTKVSIGYNLSQIGSFSIVGDSYSTFEGYNPEGNAYYYGPDGVNILTEGVFSTWWNILSKAIGSLWLNESYSGATISNKVRSTQPVTASFVNRIISKFGQAHITDPKPHVLFFFGGTNDSWINSDHGEVQYSGWTADDLKKCVNAFCYCLDQLRRWDPGLIIVNIVNTDLNAAITNGMATACQHYGVLNIPLHTFDKTDGHPTNSGMKAIAAQVCAELIDNL